MTPRALAAAVLTTSLFLACHQPVVPTPSDRSDMVRIPAGPFLMGSAEGADGFSDERPQRTIQLHAYRIDRHEVTNAAYHGFVLATGRTIPQNPNAAFTVWTVDGPSTGSEAHPVVNVTWQDAADYCAWIGRRLPTEAEWEKAARGPDGRIYPWGNEWHWSRANSASYWAGRTIEFADSRDWKAFWVNGEGARISKLRGLKGEVLTLPVGSFPDGASPYGALDMSGNAAEWVADFFNPYYYAKAPAVDPPGSEPTILKVVRGGSWLKPARSMRAADRDYGLPDDRASGVGFRCAKDD